MAERRAAVAELGEKPRIRIAHLSMCAVAIELLRLTVIINRNRD